MSFATSFLLAGERWSIVTLPNCEMIDPNRCQKLMPLLNLTEVVATRFRHNSVVVFFVWDCQKCVSRPLGNNALRVRRLSQGRLFEITATQSCFPLNLKSICLQLCDTFHLGSSALLMAFSRGSRWQHKKALLLLFM